MSDPRANAVATYELRILAVLYGEAHEPLGTEEAALMYHACLKVACRILVRTCRDVPESEAVVEELWEAASRAIERRVGRIRGRRAPGQST